MVGKKNKKNASDQKRSLRASLSDCISIISDAVPLFWFTSLKHTEH